MKKEAKSIKELIEILEQFDPNLPIECGCSPTVESHLFCLVELLGNNAIDNGEATHIAITLKEEAGKLMITVVDNGIGYNVGQNSDDSELDGGSLFVVRSITQLLNGKLHFFSAGINQGTSITLTLPINVLMQN